MRGGVEDTLATPEPGGAQAAPSRLPSAPSLLGTKFGAAPPREPGPRGARGAQHPDSGIPGGVRTSARSAALCSAGTAGVCAPSPAPQRRFTPLPRGRSGGSEAAPHAPAPAQRRGTAPAARSAPLLTAPHRTAQCSAAGSGAGSAPRRAPTCGAVPGTLRRDVTRSIPVWEGGTVSREPAGDAVPGEASPLRPGAAPHIPARRGPAAAAASPPATEPGKFVNNSQPRW